MGAEMVWKLRNVKEINMSVEHLVGVIIIVLAYFTFCALVFYSNRIVEKIHKSNAGTPRQIKRVLSSRENDDGGS